MFRGLSSIVVLTQPGSKAYSAGAWNCFYRYTEPLYVMDGVR